MTGVPHPVVRDGGELDGFRIGYLPPDVGDLVSDFASEWEDVSFATRVWERQVEEGDQVDLRVHVLRGDRLGALAELRDFLAEYHEHDLDDWAFSDFQHVEGPGLIGAVEAFWLVAPGVAVNVLTGPEGLTGDSLRAVARKVTATQTGNPAFPDAGHELTCG
ncbi:hypothetical protein [Micromonospora sp. NPDC005324]|uniref:hypothetical protein n=1 Tax=Micromonospora sp. NPDC005324 TaxID=3157033 RepID=UPI0033BA7DF4